MRTLFSFLRVSMFDATTSLSTLDSAPKTAAWMVASAAKIGLRSDMTFAASLMTGLGDVVEADVVLPSAAVMDSAEVNCLPLALVADDGEKADDDDIVSRDAIIMANDFMVEVKDRYVKAVL